MGKLQTDTFVCVDCETTGLDTEKDHIIEIAATKFTFEKTLDQEETLIDPGLPISEESMRIHNITNEMVAGKPPVEEALPSFLTFIGNHIIVGHGIQFDIQIMHNTAKRHKLKSTLSTNRFIDTLRLARLYGESPSNSLEGLRKHFNIGDEGAHRAMSDVTVNIDVFKKLSTQFKTTEALLDRLKSPIAMLTMPLGKHKGRRFSEIPVQYLSWAARQDFDQDLLFSLRSELKKRKNTNRFAAVTNPFADL